jgi:3-oxoacyl-[acyl-carrier-protein] synthase-3
MIAGPLFARQPHSGAAEMTFQPSITAVGHSAPTRLVSVSAALNQAGMPGRASAIYERFFGQQTIAQISGDDILSQMESAALECLDGVDPESITHLLYAHSINSALPTDASLIYKLRLRLGAHGARVVHLSQLNCTTGIYAVEIARQIVENARNARVLILCGELARPTIAKVITNVVVMGEAIAGCLVQAGPGLRIGASSFTTEGRFHDSEDMPAALHKRYESSYVPNMSATIQNSLAAAGLTADRVDAVFPHNVNRMSWNGVLDATGIPRERLRAETLAEYGHCFTSDPLINLHRHLTEGNEMPQVSLLCASGVGASFGSLVLHGD